MPYGKVKRTRASTRLRAKPLGTRRGAKKAVTRYKAKTFKKAVKSVLNTQIETKFKSHSYTTDFVYGAGLNFASMNQAHQKGLFYNNVMSDLHIGKGTQSNERVGSIITPVYMKIDGYVVTQDYISDSGSGTGLFNECTIPYDVKIMVLKFKPSMANPEYPSGLNILLNNSAATGTPQTDVQIDGTVGTEMLPLAHTYKCLASRRLRMRPPMSGTTDHTINMQTSNAPYYRRFRMYVPMPKRLVYEPGVNRPTNCWFSLAAYILDGTGSAIHQQQVRCKLYARASLAYKDA